MKPLSPDDRKKARESFNELLNAPDDDPHAITAVITNQALLADRQQRRQRQKGETPLTTAMKAVSKNKH